MGVYKDLAKSFSSYCYGERPYEEFKGDAIKSFKTSLDKLKGLLGEK